MRNALLLAVLAAAISALTPVQSGPVAKSETPAAARQGESVEQTLTRLDRELLDAAVRGDRALLERTELDSSIFINPGGDVQEKGQTWTGGPKFESLEADDVRVRIHGDTAVLTEHVTVKGRLGTGQDISGQYRYMRVFVRQKEQWRLVAGSAVLIQQLPTPPTPPTP